MNAISLTFWMGENWNNPNIILFPRNVLVILVSTISSEAALGIRSKILDLFRNS